MLCIKYIETYSMPTHAAFARYSVALFYESKYLYDAFDSTEQWAAGLEKNFFIQSNLHVFLGVGAYWQGWVV